ncbi:hypothetical protein ASA1KI_33990 [Opitutales bacterium ASA1]|nr:hypothetical protein ASA1KI_33990 [Opitutales bacterium ASA1]
MGNDFVVRLGFFGDDDSVEGAPEVDHTLDCHGVRVRQGSHETGASSKQIRIGVDVAGAIGACHGVAADEVRAVADGGGGVADKRPFDAADVGHDGIRRKRRRDFFDEGDDAVDRWTNHDEVAPCDGFARDVVN